MKNQDFNFMFVITNEQEHPPQYKRRFATKYHNITISNLTARLNFHLRDLRFPQLRRIFDIVDVAKIRD